MIKEEKMKKTLLFIILTLSISIVGCSQRDNDTTYETNSDDHYKTSCVYVEDDMYLIEDILKKYTTDLVVATFENDPIKNEQGPVFRVVDCVVGDLTKGDEISAKSAVNEVEMREDQNLSFNDGQKYLLFVRTEKYLGHTNICIRYTYIALNDEYGVDTENSFGFKYGEYQHYPILECTKDAKIKDAILNGNIVELVAKMMIE